MAAYILNHEIVNILGTYIVTAHLHIRGKYKGGQVHFFFKYTNILTFKGLERIYSTSLPLRCGVVVTEWKNQDCILTLRQQKLSNSPKEYADDVKFVLFQVNLDHSSCFCSLYIFLN